MISVIIPVVRTRKAREAITAARVNAGIDPVQIVSDIDRGRIGCPRMVKQLVAMADFDLVCFIGDDVVPQADYLKHALDAMNEFPDGWGLVGLNDGHTGGGSIATHWLGHKKLLPYLDGEFFCTEYTHNFCDRELTDRSRALGRFKFCPRAVIRHDHPRWTGKPYDAHYQRVSKIETFVADWQLYHKRKRGMVWKSNLESDYLTQAI